MLGDGIVIALYCQKELGVYHMSCCVVPEPKLSIGYVNGSSSVPKILDTRPPKSSKAQAMLLPNALEMQILIHAITFLEECMPVKLVWIVRKYNIGMRLGYAVQLVMRLEMHACRKLDP